MLFMGKSTVSTISMAIFNSNLLVYQCLMGKSTINGSFSIAMLVYQSVCGFPIVS